MSADRPFSRPPEPPPRPGSPGGARPTGARPAGTNPTGARPAGTRPLGAPTPATARPAGIGAAGRGTVGTTPSRPAPPSSGGLTGPEVGALDFQFLAALVRERAAIELDDSKDYLIASRLKPVAKEEGLASLTELVDRLRRAPRSRLEAKVIDAMTTNETSFFRDVHPFNALTDVIVPEVIAARGATSGLTIWCGAASSGQEPYSIAMTLTEKHPELVAANRVRIVATDISPTMVDRVKSGRYTQLEVNRGLPAKRLVKFFGQDGQDWVAARSLRSMIDTRLLNLIEPWMGLPRSDVVFLRNVLIYFSPDVKRQILGRIRTEVLKPGGFLFLGSSETTMNIDSNYQRRQVGATIVYQASGSPGPDAAR
jgi:chemotaxis protein methyltransferase CheR